MHDFSSPAAMHYRLQFGVLSVCLLSTTGTPTIPAGIWAVLAWCNPSLLRQQCRLTQTLRNHGLDASEHSHNVPLRDIQRLLEAQQIALMSQRTIIVSIAALRIVLATCLVTQHEWRDRHFSTLAELIALSDTPAAELPALPPVAFAAVPQVRYMCVRFVVHLGGHVSN